MSDPILEEMEIGEVKAVGGVRIGKSHVKRAVECMVKVGYQLEGLPTDLSNEYMKLLGEGGHIVGELARLQFPGGIMINERNTAKAIAITQAHIAQARKEGKEVVLFEPYLEFADPKRFGTTSFYFRPDVLIVRPDGFEIVEVKSKSADSKNEGAFDSTGKVELEDFFYGVRDPSKILAAWMPYAVDAVYQYWVMKNMYPQDKIDVALMLADKSKRVAVDRLPEMFEVKIDKTGWTDVEFHGDPEVVRRPENQILTKFKLRRVLETVLPKVESVVADIARRVQPDGRFAADDVKIGCGKCKGCEFTCTSERFGTSGFDQCHAEIFKQSGIPNADDLRFIYHLRKITMMNEARGATKGEIGKVADALMREGKASILDVKIPERATHWKPGQEGFEDYRRAMQIQALRTGQEVIQTEQLREVMGKWKLPWVNIDFENARFVLPPSVGMRPYECVNFQWSVHKWEDFEQEAKHSEYVNFTDPFPNFDFARKLMETCGREGTFFMWSHHEVTSLREILVQAQRMGHKDPEMVDWLEWVTNPQTTPFVDLDEVTRYYYCHPEMGGRTSIKKTAPAIWNSTPALRRNKVFVKMLKGIFGTMKASDLKSLDDLYGRLKPVQVGDQLVNINVGTGAIKGYQLAMYSKYRKDPKIVKLLLKAHRDYCGLDTLNMMFVEQGYRVRLCSDLPLFEGGAETVGMAR